MSVELAEDSVVVDLVAVVLLTNISGTFKRTLNVRFSSMCRESEMSVFPVHFMVHDRNIFQVPLIHTKCKI